MTTEEHLTMGQLGITSDCNSADQQYQIRLYGEVVFTTKDLREASMFQAELFGRIRIAYLESKNREQRISSGDETTD